MLGFSNPRLNSNLGNLACVSWNSGITGSLLQSAVVSNYNPHLAA